MNNRIMDVQVTQKRWDGAEAELWITVLPEQQTPTTAIRGRLVGPRCPGVTTLEVAYPLQHLPHPDPGAAGLTMRVVIADPLPWEPDRPYAYEGPVELWQDGQKCDQRALSVRGRLMCPGRVD